MKSVLTAFTYTSTRFGLLGIGTSRLPPRPLDRLGDELVEVFAELANTVIRPLTSVFADQPGWRAFVSDLLDEDGRRYFIVVAPTKHSALDVRERLLDEARNASVHIEEIQNR